MSQQLNYGMQSFEQPSGFQPDLRTGSSSGRSLTALLHDDYASLTPEEREELEDDPEAPFSDMDEEYRSNCPATAEMNIPAARTSIGGAQTALPNATLAVGSSTSSTVDFQFPAASPATPMQPQRTDTDTSDSSFAGSGISRPLMMTPTAQALGVPEPPTTPMSGPALYSALGAGMDDGGLGTDVEENDGDGGDNSNADGSTSKKKRRRGFNAMNLSGIHHSIATLASHIYAVRTATGNPFPMQIRDVNAPHNPRDVLAASSWCEAVQLIFGQNQIIDGTGLMPSPGEMHEIKKRDTGVRGRFKMAARTRVPAQYHFLTTVEAETDIEMMSRDNRALVEKLKAEDSFVFQNPFAIDTPGTIYRNRVIKDIILDSLYNNRERSLGVVLQHIIADAMPLPAIALAATAVSLSYFID
ncbi:hypothetical protein V5O48_016605 [Marasmius crinis-equi]|uniref:DUF6532 domain-containing protein n=1 Tax=Marasmius crinis-equi TaxID=585013 RepID=A0ABR3ERE1_9AGAR